MQITKVKDENDLSDFSKIRERLIMTCVPADDEYVKQGALETLQSSTESLLRQKAVW